MKKYIFLIVIFFTTTFSHSQEPIIFSEVVNIENVDKNELYIRGREWFNESFISSKDILQINDQQTGELVGKCFFAADCTYTMMGKSVTIPADVYFQVSLWVKDNKYKYEFKNFHAPGSISGYSSRINLGQITTSNETELKIQGIPKKRMNEIYLSIKNSTLTKSQLLIESLKSKMANKSKSTDW